MTKTTDSRQLRMMVDGILSAYGIDNLQLSIDLCGAFKKFYASDTPVRTREDILAGIKNALEKGMSKQEELEKIRTEIETRLHISPVGREWEDFIGWAWKQEKDSSQPIDTFLSWWVSDEWRLAHPPVNPQRFYVQWPQAFIVTETHTRPEYKKLENNDENSVPNPNKERPAILRK